MCVWGAGAIRLQSTQQIGGRPAAQQKVTADR